MRDRRRTLALLLTAAACAVGLWLVFRDPLAGIDHGGSAPVAQNPSLPKITRPVHAPRDESGYIGSAACRECHAAICETYDGHPMWQAARSIAAAEPVEVYGEDRGFQHTGELYYAEKTTAGAVHHIVARDDTGEVVYDMAQPVTLEIGSGGRGRAFLLQHGKLLFQSPLTWYSGGGVWDLSPGYMQSNRRFERRIVDGCVACHVGRMNRDPRQIDCFADVPVIEAGIGCERCHGPAAEHVAWHKLAERPDEPDPIVNPALLPPEARESVCQQCHLTGADRVLRYGRSEYDFRPGDHLSDIWAPFVHESAGDAGQPTLAVSQVEQMESSRCYLGSAGRFGCTSCHDPHSSPAAEFQVEYYRQRCLECHGGSDVGCGLPEPDRLTKQADGSCIACHMPRSLADDVPHTSQTDHRVLARPAPIVAPGSATNSPRVVLAESAAERMPEWERRRAEGIMLARRAANNKDPVLADHAVSVLRPLAADLSEDLPLQAAFASALKLTGDLPAATDIWRAILEADPRHEQALEQLAISHHESGEYEAALGYLDRLLTINDFLSDYHGRRSHILGHMGRYDEALEAAERAASLNPSNPQLHEWMAEVYRRRDEPELSREQAKLAERLRELQPPSFR
jgi:predicted CXXCH cytochrome family protein